MNIFEIILGLMACLAIAFVVTIIVSPDKYNSSNPQSNNSNSFYEATCKPAGYDVVCFSYSGNGSKISCVPLSQVGGKCK